MMTAYRSLLPRLLPAAALSLACLGGAGLARAAEPSRFDTELERPVEPGDRLEVRNYRGRVEISAWAEDRVRLEAEHPRAEPLRVEKRGATLRVVPRSWERDAGAFDVRPPERVQVRVVDRPPPPVDLRLRVPAWMPVTVEMPYGDVSVDGTEAAVRVMVVAGDVTISGAGSPVSVVSMQGETVLERAAGRLTLEGARGTVTVRDCAGDLRVETSSGDVILEGLRTDNTEVESLAGAITYLGALVPRGNYELSTHSGDVTLELAGGVPDARISARSVEGRIDAPLLPEPPADPHRLEATLGAGDARVRLWSFTGRVTIRSRSR